MWEGEGSLSNFPNEGFSGDNSQNRQMVSFETFFQECTVGTGVARQTRASEGGEAALAVLFTRNT